MTEEGERNVENVSCCALFAHAALQSALARFPTRSRGV